MRPYLIRASVERVPVGFGSTYVNRPVNMSQVFTFEKRHNDQGLQARRYKIVFYASGMEAFWAYLTEEQRDADYGRLCMLFQYDTHSEGGVR